MPERTYYRLILGTVPVIDDFRSKFARHEPLRPPITPYRQRLHAGVSMFIDEAHAVAKLAQLRPPHAAVAMLRLGDDDPVEAQQTGRDPLHWTLWAPAELLLARVHSILIGAQQENQP